MANMFRYAAINSKLKVRQRAFLNYEDYETVLNFSTIGQMIQFLKDKVDYQEGFIKMDRYETHRGDLEVILHQYEVSEIEKMIHYFSGPYRAFFKTMLMEYEILDLQLILRSIAKGEDLEMIRERFLHSSKYSKLDYNMLLSVKTIEQFMESLRGSIFYNPLKTLTLKDTTQREFHMEMKLYFLYYQELMKKTKELDKKDQNIAKDIIGTVIDNINIQWVYRGNKYYKITPIEILIYVLPEGKKLSYARLKELCYTPNQETFEKTAKKYLGYDLFKEDNDIFLERTMDRHLHEHYLKQKGENHIGTCLTYIYELILQIKDIVSITECIRYGYGEDEKRKYLIRMY